MFDYNKRLFDAVDRMPKTVSIRGRGIPSVVVAARKLCKGRYCAVFYPQKLKQGEELKRSYCLRPLVSESSAGVTWPVSSLGPDPSGGIKC